MSVKANLRVVLHANDVVVAESEDQKLWQNVLAYINSDSAGDEIFEAKVAKTVISGDDLNVETEVQSDIDILANMIGVSPKEIVASCDPSFDSPYIYLDKHHWENFKKNTPVRGPNAVNSTVLSLTLLVLWKEVAKLELPTLKEAKAVNDTIGTVDKNPLRSLRNCSWLQERGGRIRLNPVQTSKAESVAKAYCKMTVKKET